MAQSPEELNHSCSAAHSPSGEVQHGDKESSGYQTDFSVTNRLLTPYNSSAAGLHPHHGPSGTISYRNGENPYQPHGYISSMPGWQNLLPNDQGGLSSRSYQQTGGWTGGAVPNMNIATAAAAAAAGAGYANVGYSADGQTSSYHPTQSPDSSTGGSMTFKDSKETGGSSSTLSNGDKSTIKKYCHEMTSGEADDEDSGESEAESSAHSSHGEAESVDEPKKPKRTRTAFSNLQLDQLELAFSRSHYPDVFTREDLSNKLNIKEDRIQVWFQNRRARYRKQERTGSVSLRSKYRQKRLQKLQQTHAAAAATMTGYAAGYYPSCGPSPSQTMLTSPHSVSPYVPGFAFPPNYTPSSMSGGGSSSAAIGTEGLTAGSSGGASVPTTLATSPGYFPGFNAAIKGTFPIPGYMTMGINHHNGGSPYSTAAYPSNIIATPVSQK